MGNGAAGDIGIDGRAETGVGGAARDPTGSAPHATSSFVGRSTELVDLRSALDDAARGSGRFVLISGEPGIGKTRLAAELTHEARAREITVCWGRCWEGGGAPSFWPWVEILRQLLATGDPGAQPAARSAARLAQLVPELADVAGGVAASTVDPESSRFLLFDAVATFVRERATRQALVLIVDDLHVADPASVMLLGFLARALADTGVLLIATYRDTEAELLAAASGSLAELVRQARRISLRGLAVADVGEMVAQVTRCRPSTSLVGEIHAATAGNPFFVDEILRSMMLDGREAAAAAGEPLGIPDSVREAVRRRLAPLDAHAVDTLEVAAVVGREFDLVVLRGAMGREHLELLDALAEPIRRGLVHQLRGSPGRFTFRHALIRDILYADLAPARRLSLHLRIGDALEQLSCADPERYVSELAHHFLAAAPGGTDERFVVHGLRAVARAVEQMAFEEAVALCERILDALVYARPDERRRAEVLLALGNARERASDGTGAHVALEHVAVIAHRLGAADLLARAALGIGAGEALKFTASSRCPTAPGIGAGEALKFTASSRCPTAPGLLREALRAIAPDDVTTRARLLGRLAMHAYFGGSTAEGLQLGTEAVAAARGSGDGETLAGALTALHAALWAPDHLAERIGVADELLAVGAALGSREFAMRGHALRITDLLELGDMPSLDDAIEAHGRLAEETGDVFDRWANASIRATRAMIVGALDEAQRHLQETLAMMRVPGLHKFEINAPMAFAGQTILLEDLLGEDTIDLTRADELSRRYPEMVIWRMATVHVLGRRGRLDDVRRELERCGAAGCGDCTRNGYWLPTMVLLSEATARLGDRDRATALYPLLLPYADRNASISFVGSLGPVSRALGELAVVLGDAGAATGHFESALAMATRMGAKPYVAKTSYQFASFLASGDAACAARARTLAEDALRIADELGMKRAADDARALVEHLRVTTASSRPDAAEAIVLRSEGPFWTIAHGSERAHVKDSRGLAYIAELVRQPRREIHVLDLLVLGNGRAFGANGAYGELDVAGHADELLDRRARHAYRRRADELAAELEAATSAGDPEAVSALREELSALERELARAVGLNGRSRHASAAERARINVTRTIRLALSHIVDAAPLLGEHLARSVRTGTYCSYAPERDPREARSFAAGERIVPRRFTPLS